VVHSGLHSGTQWFTQDQITLDFLHVNLWVNVSQITVFVLTCAVVVLICFVICVFVFTVFCIVCTVLFVLFRFCIVILICFVCTSVRTTATE
jgi:hypothetical protein